MTVARRTVRRVHSWVSARPRRATRRRWGGTSARRGPPPRRDRAPYSPRRSRAVAGPDGVRRRNGRRTADGTGPRQQHDPAARAADCGRRTPDITQSFGGLADLDPGGFADPYGRGVVQYVRDGGPRDSASRATSALVGRGGRRNCSGKWSIAPASFETADGAVRRMPVNERSGCRSMPDLVRRALSPGAETRPTGRGGRIERRTDEALLHAVSGNRDTDHAHDDLLTCPARGPDRHN